MRVEAPLNTPDGVPRGTGSSGLKGPAHAGAGAVSYFLSVLLWMYLVYWVKLHFLLADASAGEEFGIRSWNALETGYIPFAGLLLAPAHLLVVLVRLSVDGGVAISARSIVLASLLASAMMVTLLFLVPPMHWIINLGLFGVVTSYLATRLCYRRFLRVKHPPPIRESQL